MFCLSQNHSRFKLLNVVTILFFIASLIIPDLVRLESAFALAPVLPAPGQMLKPSEHYSFPVLKAIRLDPKNPLNIEFIVDTGTQANVSQEEASRLINYFLAGLAIPESDLWVNLSPYEKDRVVPQELGSTDLGKDMLGQDYVLKQLSASLTYPESDTGKDYWSNIYSSLPAAEIKKLSTFNKVWITPDSARILEHKNMAVIDNAYLKAQLESDMTALQKAGAVSNPQVNQIMREVVLPKINKELNDGKNFATLRQIYYSLLLAAWFKDKFKQSFYQDYINKGNIQGIDLNDKQAKEKVYNLYVQAFSKGLYNYIKKETLPSTIKGNPAEQRVGGKTVYRRYFSGGVVLGDVLKKTTVESTSSVNLKNDKPEGTFVSVFGQGTSERGATAGALALINEESGLNPLPKGIGLSHSPVFTQNNGPRSVLAKKLLPPNSAEIAESIKRYEYQPGAAKPEMMAIQTLVELSKNRDHKDLSFRGYEKAKRDLGQFIRSGGEKPFYEQETYDNGSVDSWGRRNQSFTFTFSFYRKDSAVIISFLKFGEGFKPVRSGIVVVENAFEAEGTNKLDIDKNLFDKKRLVTSLSNDPRYGLRGYAEYALNNSFESKEIDVKEIRDKGMLVKYPKLLDLDGVADYLVAKMPKTWWYWVPLTGNYWDRRDNKHERNFLYWKDVAEKKKILKPFLDRIKKEIGKIENVEKKQRFWDSSIEMILSEVELNTNQENDGYEADLNELRHYYINNFMSLFISYIKNNMKKGPPSDYVRMNVNSVIALADEAYSYFKQKDKSSKIQQKETMVNAELREAYENEELGKVDGANGVYPWVIMDERDYVHKKIRELFEKRDAAEANPATHGSSLALGKGEPLGMHGLNPVSDKRIKKGESMGAPRRPSDISLEHFKQLASKARRLADDYERIRQSEESSGSMVVAATEDFLAAQGKLYTAMKDNELDQFGTSADELIAIANGKTAEAKVEEIYEQRNKINDLGGLKMDNLSAATEKIGVADDLLPQHLPQGSEMFGKDFHMDIIGMQALASLED
jgi:hypothetical protein